MADAVLAFNCGTGKNLPEKLFTNSQNSQIRHRTGTGATRGFLKIRLDWIGANRRQAASR
jgi:hypothetical protein